MLECEAQARALLAVANWGRGLQRICLGWSGHSWACPPLAPAGPLCILDLVRCQSQANVEPITQAAAASAQPFLAPKSCASLHFCFFLFIIIFC